MKSTQSPGRRAAALAVCVSLLMLAGCGQKGPLFKPKVPPDPLAQSATQAGTADGKPAAAGTATGDK